jgi:hypothetical protein
LDHSQSRLILIDHEYTHLAKDAKVPVIISQDTGRVGDPYEEFLSSGRKFSAERGWLGLDLELDEDAGAALCYTCVSALMHIISSHSGLRSSGTTGRVSSSCNWDMVD